MCTVSLRVPPRTLTATLLLLHGWLGLGDGLVDDNVVDNFGRTGLQPLRLLRPGSLPRHADLLHLDVLQHLLQASLEASPQRHSG